MYAYIKGEIVDISEDNVVLECHDIGYNIKVPFSVIQQLPGIGSQVRIYTYTCVREDAFILFNEICENKVDEDQIEACLYDPDNFPIKTYNNIENKLYVM